MSHTWDLYHGFRLSSYGLPRAAEPNDRMSSSFLRQVKLCSECRRPNPNALGVRAVTGIFSDTTFAVAVSSAVRDAWV